MKKMFILPHGTWNDTIRSVILDWRKRSSGRSNEGERSAGLSSEGRETLVTQADLSAPRVCPPTVALLHNRGPRHRRKICANSLTGCIPTFTQSSPSKNKNMNYIFIYLRALRCLSSSAICDENGVSKQYSIFPTVLAPFPRPWRPNSNHINLCQENTDYVIK